MQEFDFILLLSKRFSGEISPGESAALEAWIHQSPENERRAAQYETIWKNSTEQPSKTFQLDLDAEYRRLQARLQPARVVPIGRRALRIAAALLFVLLSVWALRQFAGVQTPATLVATASPAEKRQLDLPDGTRVWLRQNARLEYPSSFDNRERRVKLNGEAYFEVAHQTDRPFRVQLEDGGLVEVLGTRFSVRTSQGTPETSVLVCAGKVRFSPDGKSEGAVLSPNKKAVFDRRAAQLRVLDAPTLNELAWQTGGLEFVRTPLAIVLTDLETHYQVNIELRNPALRRCLHTAPRTNQPIEQVLESLSLTYQLQVSNPAPGRFILSGGQCQ